MLTLKQLAAPEDFGPNHWWFISFSVYVENMHIEGR